MGYVKVPLKEADKDRLKAFMEAALDRDDVACRASRAGDAINLVFLIVCLGGVATLTVVYNSQKEQVERVRPCSSMGQDREARGYAIKLLQHRDGLREVLRGTIPPVLDLEECLF
jgi:hypothetical protein